MPLVVRPPGLYSYTLISGAKHNNHISSCATCNKYGLCIKGLVSEFLAIQTSIYSLYPGFYLVISSHLNLIISSHLNLHSLLHSYRGLVSEYLAIQTSIYSLYLGVLYLVISSHLNLHSLLHSYRTVYTHHIMQQLQNIF